MKPDFFLARKTCRNFKADKIDISQIEEMVVKAAKAPTCGNMQLYSVIVTQDENMKNKLAQLHYNQPAAISAPVILTICADFNRFTDWCEINNADAGYDNFHSFIMALTDAIIFSQQLVTVAEMEGFGTCYLGTVNYNAKEISDLLSLPDLVVPVASISLGYPECETEETNRLPVDALIHMETYHIPEPEKIKEWFDVHDSDPTNEKFIKENNKKNLAQVFAEVRYPRSSNESVSKNFISLLKEKRFINS